MPQSSRTWMARQSFLAAVLGCMAALSLVGCGDDPDGGAPDNGTDVMDSDADGDADADADTGLDVPAELGPDVPVPECGPGQRRCSTGTEASELCDDDGFWQATSCGTGEICFEGTCATPGVCTPLEVNACAGCSRYVGCNSVGTAVGEFDVPFTQTCQNVDGVDQFVARVCFPGDARCVDTSVLEACDECGLGYRFATDCRADDETTLCDVDRCTPLCEFIQKRNTYIGCEYWAVDLDNAFVPAGGGQFIDADAKPFAVVVTNPNVDLVATVTVEMQDRVVATVDVQPGALEVLKLHFYANEFDTTGQPLSNIQGTMIGYEGFRVSSTVPIIAYQFNPLDNEIVYSNDASLLFPTSSLGTEYLVMTRRQTFDSLKGYVTVVATQPGTTEVTVTLPPYTLENPVETLSGVDVVRSVPIPRMRGGQAYTVALEQYMVLNIETDRIGADLTGTEVRSNRPVAVFGGAEAANAPNDDNCVYRPTRDDWVCEATRTDRNPRACVNAAGEPDISFCSDYITCCADHIEHQMLPVFAWGRNFVAARSAPRGDEADVWRIMAARDNTRVTLVGLPDDWPLRDLLPRFSEISLNRGEWVDFQSPVDFEIVSDKPIMVGQFLAAEFAPFPQTVGANKPPHRDANTGDPAFMLVVPVEQYRTDYTFLCPDAFEFDYVTIAAPATATVSLNGEVIAEAQWNTFGRGDFRTARIRIPDGVHNVVSDEPVGVMVYGYDRFVSYGYAAGLDIREISARE